MINHRYDPYLTASDISTESGGTIWSCATKSPWNDPLLGYQQNYRSRRSAKAPLCIIETSRTIKCGRIYRKQAGLEGENEIHQCSTWQRGL